MSFALRALRVLAISFGLGYLGLCAWLFAYQRSLLYFPEADPGNAGEAITLRTSGAMVVVSTRLKEGPRALLYFGGNAEDVSVNMPDLSVAFPDYSIYLMHYRGYGGSSGSPSEKALFADALKLFDEVHGKHPAIDVVGRSLGSGVAVYLASQRPVARLILVTPYDSVLDIAALQYPYFPVRWLLRDKFESWRFAAQVTAPTTIIAAEHDEIIPRASTELLRSRFTRTATNFKVVRGTGHNTISSNSEYLELLKSGH